MRNPESSNNTLPDELFDIYVPDISQRFSFDSLSEIICANQYILFISYCFRERTYNIQSLLSKRPKAVKRIKTPPGWWMFGSNLWHWSHFLTYSCASFCMSGYQYTWVMAWWDKDLPLVWLPQTPSWSSSRSDSNASWCTQSKYGPEKEHLYNFLSLGIQNWGAFLRTFSASDFSSGNTSLSRNIDIGSIQLGP